MNVILSRLRKMWSRRRSAGNPLLLLNPHNARPGDSITFEISDDINSDTDSVCEMFSYGQSSEVYEYLRRNSESPVQVPFYYLELVRLGSVKDSTRFAKLSAEQVRRGYQSILQRPPERRAIVRHHLKTQPNTEQFIAALLTSQEAILRMPELHARAFPCMSRLWHVHIPKTAGSSFFSAAEESGWGYINTNLLSESVGDMQRLAHAVRLSPKIDGSVIISGHWQLLQHLDSINRSDRVVVFVRDPVECMISEFNYAVDVVNCEPNVHFGEPWPFLDRGLDPTSFKRTYERGFFVFNLQCSFLSADGTCASALKNLSACNAELLPSDAVNRAVSEFFAPVAQRRINVSNKHVTSVDIGRLMREEIVVRSHQDILLNQIAGMRYQELRSV